MTDKIRIRLAEAMGWQKHPDEHWWICPNTGYSATPPGLPDPKNNANDCEALIRWLNTQGLQILIDFAFDVVGPKSPEHDLGDISALDHVAMFDVSSREWTHHWEGDNWKQGVCELACKVLEQE